MSKWIYTENDEEKEINSYNCECCNKSFHTTELIEIIHDTYAERYCPDCNSLLEKIDF